MARGINFNINYRAVASQQVERIDESHTTEEEIPKI